MSRTYEGIVADQRALRSRFKNDPLFRSRLDIGLIYVLGSPDFGENAFADLGIPGANFSLANS